MCCGRSSRVSGGSGPVSAKKKERLALKECTLSLEELKSIFKEITDPYAASIVKSAINMYNKDCSKYQSFITTKIIPKLKT